MIHFLAGQAAFWPGVNPRRSAFSVSRKGSLNRCRQNLPMALAPIPLILGPPNGLPATIAPGVMRLRSRLPIQALCGMW